MGRSDASFDLHIDFAADLPTVEAVLTEAVVEAPHVNRVNGVRVVSLDKGMKLAIEPWHGSTTEQERLAQESANRSDQGERHQARGLSSRPAAHSAPGVARSVVTLRSARR